MICISQEFYKEHEKIRREYYLELLKLKKERGLKNINRFRENVLWAINNVEPKIHISFGNAKLPKSTCIINLGTWFNCSGRKNNFCNICEKCYDKQIEVRFKERIKDRLEQEIFWRTVNTNKFANEIIKKIMEHDGNIQKTNLIRWSEVGEIRNQKDLEKIRDVSNIIYNTLGIKSYIYTHNKDLNFNINRPNLTINGSGFMVDNEYKVVLNKEKEFNDLYDLSNKRECICDCNNCSYCSNKNGFILIEELR